MGELPATTSVHHLPPVLARHGRYPPINRAPWLSQRGYQIRGRSNTWQLPIPCPEKGVLARERPFLRGYPASYNPAIAGLVIATVPKGAHRGVGDAIKMAPFFDAVN